MKNIDIVEPWIGKWEGGAVGVERQYEPASGHPGEKRLKSHALNKARNDAEFQAIAGCLINPNIGENLQRTLGGETEAGKYPLYLFALLQPTIFQGFASAQDDTRYRVLIPTTGYVMADTYKALCEQVVHVVQRIQLAPAEAEGLDKALPWHRPRQNLRGQHDVFAVPAGTGRPHVFRGLRRYPR